MSISIRFEGRPLPTNVKVYGIDYEESTEMDNLVAACGLLYTTQYKIKDTGVIYNIVFPLQNKGAKSFDILHPIMAFAKLS
uniref:Uncharacterized protein n=1 Tax=Alsidium seaforthii TaxID=2007182 RepID=A0A1Z1MDQ6_9FLOR|nr:hypothetical protein [Bryothamnion seaforthii]ARW63884.1 hypothetical protein [Bryothamnion seaforthii]